MYGSAVHNGVRAGDIDVLKHAQPAFLAAVRADGAAAVLVKYHNLARLHVAHELAARRHNGAAFACDYIALANLPDAQGTEPLRVAHGNELARAHQHQRIGSFELGHGLFDGAFNAARVQALARDGIGNYLGIGGRVENRAGQLKFIAQLGGIGQVAVMGQRHRPFDMADDKRLCVRAHGRTRGGVATVRHTHIAARHRFQRRLGEYFAHKPQFTALIEDAVVVHGNAAALLSAVLQRVQTVIGGGHYIQIIFTAEHAEYAAFLMQLFAEYFFSHAFLFPQ